MNNKKSHWLRTLLVTASAVLLLGSMAYFVSDAEAGRDGGGSVASAVLFLGSTGYVEAEAYAQRRG